MTNKLENIINKACDTYNIPDTTRGLALVNDPRGLSAIGQKVGSTSSKMSPTDIHEVTKWGINWGLSNHPEIRQHA